MREQQLEALQTAYEYIERLYSGCYEAAMQYKEGQKLEGDRVLIQLVDGIDWVIQVIELTRDLIIQEVKVKNIIPKLEELVEGLENTDVVLVADLLEYEVMPQLEEWHKIIGESLEQK